MKCKKEWKAFVEVMRNVCSNQFWIPFIFHFDIVLGNEPPEMVFWCRIRPKPCARLVPPIICLVELTRTLKEWLLPIVSYPDFDLWPYSEKKITVTQLYIQKPGCILDFVVYTFTIISMNALVRTGKRVIAKIDEKMQLDSQSSSSVFRLPT